MAPTILVFVDKLSPDDWILLKDDSEDPNVGELRLFGGGSVEKPPPSPPPRLEPPW